MGQYYGGFHIKVKSKDDWKKIADIDASDKDEYVQDVLTMINECGPDEGGLDFFSDMDVCMDERELADLGRALYSAIGDSLLFVGVTSNINVDPYSYVVYYLFGMKDDIKCFDDDYNNGKYNDMWEENIADLSNWLSKIKGVLRLNAEQKEELKKYGIIIK